MNRTIQGICDAYESGHGMGYDKRSLTNPYPQDVDEYDAWEYGHDTGAEKRKRYDASTRGGCPTCQ